MAEKQNKDLLFRVGHRDRLRQKFVDDKITDDEILELILADVIPRRDVRPLARRLIADFGSVSNILRASIDDLIAFNGIGKNTAIHLKLINKLMYQGYKENLRSNPLFKETELFLNYCLSAVDEKDTEEFHVIYLDNMCRLIKDEKHSVGTWNWAPIFEREIIKRALNLNATSLILFHNHPTGVRDFSSDDIHATTVLENMLNTVGLKLYDHYLICRGRVYSARDQMLLNKSSKLANPEE